MVSLAGFSTVLKPCCTPNFFTGLCGDVDISNNRQPLYSVCSNPSQAFFWDNNHPTSAGWQVVFERLLSSPIFTGGKSLPEFLLKLY
jgi:phospholipase/lecithinase/hemolysin